MIFMRRENLDKDLEKEEGLVWRYGEGPFWQTMARAEISRCALLRFTSGDGADPNRNVGNHPLG